MACSADCHSLVCINMFLASVQYDTPENRAAGEAIAANVLKVTTTPSLPLLCQAWNPKHPHLCLMFF